MGRKVFFHFPFFNRYVFLFDIKVLALALKVGELRNKVVCMGKLRTTEMRI